MNFHDWIMLISVIGSFAILGFKLFNILHKSEKYDIRMSWLLFIGAVVLLGMGFLITLTVPQLEYGIFLSFISTFFILNIVFLLIEHFFNWNKQHKETYDAYNPSKL